MGARLERVQDWPAQARQARWSALALAKQCNVSVRTLQRHFRKEMGQSPQTWLMGERHRRAKAILAGGLTVKETAALLSYSDAAAFSRAFKKLHGIGPSRFGLPPGGSQNAVNCRLLT